MKSPLKCIVVGAGPTGSMITCFLKRLYKDGLQIQVWDKSRGIGGRMSTHRHGEMGLDLGAQYVSATPEYMTKHASLYEELNKQNVLKHLDTAIDGMRGSLETTHYVAPSGIASLPKYFIQQSGCDVKGNLKLEGVEVKNSMVEAFATASIDRKEEMVREDADVVILTMPVPQIMQLSGDIPSLLNGCHKQMSDVRYSLRFALGLFYPPTAEVDVSWSAKYTPKNPCLCFISIDNKKRGKDLKHGLSIVAHASVPWTIRHFDDDFKDVEKAMTEQLMKELPGLPSAATHSRLLRWRYSQVQEPYDGTPGHIVLNENPLVLCAGDGFTHSNFDGCVDSALSTVEYFKARFPYLSKI